MNNENIKKILIIRLSAIGDTIHTLPLAFALKNKFPDVQLDWVVEDKASAFVKNNPLLDNVYIIEKNNKFQSAQKAIKKIRKEKYDIAIDTQQLLKSGVILGFSKAKRKVTLDGGREFSFIFANEIIKTNKKLFDINYHVVNRNLEFAKYFGCDISEPQILIPNFDNEISENIKNIINNIDKTKKTIVLSPATTWTNKHWSVNGWQDIIREFANTFNIIITAAEKEKELTRNIIEPFGDCVIDLTGKTTLKDLVYIFKNADMVISPDSGSTHIAWAAGCKSIITLFFATSAKRNAPIGKNYYSISADIECSPCMRKKCKISQKNKCCEKINSAEIIKIVNKVLK